MNGTIRRTPVDTWIAGRLAIPLGDVSQERLSDWQIASFRHTLAYAKSKSRFYKRLFRDVEPDSVRAAEDLLSIPCTSELELAGNEMDFLCVNQKEVSRIVTVPTTGTLGNQKRVCFSDADRHSSMVFIEVGFRTLVTPPARMLVMMSGVTEGSIGRTVEKSLAPLGIETYIYGGISSVADAYEYMLQCRPTTIVGVPHQIAALSRYGRAFGNPESAYIRSVLLSADDIPDSLRRSIGTLWGCRVFNHYGMTEFGIAGGVECEGFSGYHTRDCDLLFEIVDRDESGTGEIVFTTLDREAMPLIRYRTGDLGRFTTDVCPCGSPLRRIEKVFGRKRNTLNFADGGCARLSEIGDAVFSEPDTIDYECTIFGDGNIEIVVNTLPGETVDTSSILERLKQNPAVGRAIDEGTRVVFRHVEKSGFPDKGNEKKRLIACEGPLDERDPGLRAS
jgi:phenylacetate-coenzyme A ligase PaaK-like adenylate-forming protein